ncbi:hypothetical protein EUX98_g4576 [Antrodiella citrinella]|uniref:J domain-containing protein n=1 Tax=Antrodiella citrinella TaxID=2447956 RepID=A0A4S4MVJ6_9APHY|nr:hypothetical protein EUX98_g4576 [Antrodiella citrinella]
MIGSTLLLLSSILLLAVLVNAADLYKVLDIDRSASDKDVRAAYKRLSRKYHPDKNKEEGAEEKFVEVAHAYEILSDTQKRQIYDRHGEEGLKAHEGGQQHHANPFDMFQSFFGAPPSGQVRKGPTSLMEMEINLSDMYTGASVEFMVKKRILCDHCRGSGAASSSDIHTCTGCNGQGVKIVRQQIFPGMFSQAQVSYHTQRYTLEVPVGTPEGHEIVFEGEADESPDWEAGDIVIRVRSKKDSGAFRRKERALYWKETISVDEQALLGFERNLTHLDGHIVHLKRESVTQPGYVQTIKEEGMPIYEESGRGDLFVEYNVVLPKSLSPQMRKRVAEAFRGEHIESEKPGKDEL